MGQKPLDRTPTWAALIESAKTGCGFLMLGHRRFTLVDEDVMVMWEGANWSYDPRGYVKRNTGPAKKREVEYMHRAIMNPPQELEVDHWNRIKWDNRRENLRLSTQSQNNANTPRRSHNATSQFKGVRQNLHKWTARGIFNKREYHLGSFATELEAAAAYNAWALVTFGEFALLNVLP